MNKIDHMTGWICSRSIFMNSSDHPVHCTGLNIKLRFDLIGKIFIRIGVTIPRRRGEMEAQL